MCTPSSRARCGPSSSSAPGASISRSSPSQRGFAWYRWFEGGEEALRAVANTIHRTDRRYATLDSSTRDHHRHDLRAHGGTFVDEAREIDRHLLALGAEPLVDDGLETFCYGTNPSSGPWREPGWLLWRFTQAVSASYGFAQGGWTDDDTRTWAHVRSKLPLTPPPTDETFARPPMNLIRQAAARL